MSIEINVIHFWDGEMTHACREEAISASVVLELVEAGSALDAGLTPSIWTPARDHRLKNTVFSPLRFAEKGWEGMLSDFIYNTEEPQGNHELGLQGATSAWGLKGRNSRTWSGRCCVNAAFLNCYRLLWSAPDGWLMGNCHQVVLSFFFFRDPFSFRHRLSFLFIFFSTMGSEDSFFRISLTSPWKTSSM